LSTDGEFSPDGSFHRVETWDAAEVMRLFRGRLLARLVDRHAISEELVRVRRLLAWRHPGFSAHMGEAMAFEDRKVIDDVACYLVRNALPLKRLVYLDGQQAVLYRSRMNPTLGRNARSVARQGRAGPPCSTRASRPPTQRVAELLAGEGRRGPLRTQHASTILSW
jgi:hypothetical protein